MLQMSIVLTYMVTFQSSCGLLFTLCTCDMQTMERPLAPSLHSHGAFGASKLLLVYS